MKTLFPAARALYKCPNVSLSLIYLIWDHGKKGANTDQTFTHYTEYIYARSPYS